MKRIATVEAAIIVGWFPLLGTVDAGWVIHSQDTGSCGKAAKR